MTKAKAKKETVKRTPLKETPKKKGTIRLKNTSVKFVTFEKIGDSCEGIFKGSQPASKKNYPPSYLFEGIGDAPNFQISASKNILEQFEFNNVKENSHLIITLRDVIPIGKGKRTFKIFDIDLVT